jgi:hypothetical protein
MIFVPVLAALSSLLAVDGPALSQGLTVIRPIPGYVCMRLNLSREQMLARPFNVPVFAEPSSTSGKVGQASATVITKSPLHVQNGFAEILFLDGRIAWIPVNLLGPYATPANPNAHCTPSIMSDGKPGFG